MHECLASPAMQDAAGEAHFSVSLAATMEAATCQGDEILKTVLRTQHQNDTKTDFKISKVIEKAFFFPKEDNRWPTDI